MKKCLKLYLRSAISAGSGCELSVVTHCECSRRKFCHLLPLSINRNLQVLTGCSMFSTGVRSVMLACSRVGP